MDLIPVAQRSGEPTRWRSLGFAVLIVVLASWLGLRNLWSTLDSPLPFYSLFLLIIFDPLASLGLPGGLHLWLIAGIYGVHFCQWMTVDSRLDRSRIKLRFVLFMGVLCVGNLYIFWEDPVWPPGSGISPKEYWPVSVAPPFLLFVYGLVCRHEAGFVKRTVYYTLCWAWIGFGNLPFTGEWI